MGIIYICINTHRDSVCHLSDKERDTILNDPYLHLKVCMSHALVSAIVMCSDQARINSRPYTKWCA